MPAALVTGAGGGIGRAVVERLVRDGYTVTAADRDKAGLATIADIATTVVMDVTGEASVRSVLAGVTSLDVLVTAAGTGSMSPTAQLPLREWNRTLEVNLTGTFLVCREALPALLQARGSIVAVASTGGLRATPYNAAYCASKAGVIMFTKVLAAEYAKQGLRANTVCPGSVNTPFLAGFVPPPDADMDVLIQLAGPAPRLLEPAEVADAVGYLVSASAAAITGTALPLDSGSTA